MTTESAAHYGPGDVCPESGIWAATSGEKADIALSAGDRFPPLEERGARWVLVRPTGPGPALRGPDGHPVDPDATVIRAADAGGYLAAVTELATAARVATALGPDGPSGRRARALAELGRALKAYDAAIALEEAADLIEDRIAEHELQDAHDREHELAERGE